LHKGCIEKEAGLHFSSIKIDKSGPRSPRLEYLVLRVRSAQKLMHHKAVRLRHSRSSIEIKKRKEQETIDRRPSPAFQICATLSYGLVATTLRYTGIEIGFD
jgi:hypothetical protein